MDGVLVAEAAVLGELKPVGVVLLVLEGVVVTLLAFGAGQGDLYAHGGCYSSQFMPKPNAGRGQ